MKSFVDVFTSARAVSTPLVAVRTFDNASTIQTLAKTLDAAPALVWNCVEGLKALNKTGEKELASLLAKAQIEDIAATIPLTVTLNVAKLVDNQSDTVFFIENFQLQTKDSDAQVIQGVMNLRDKFKASGAMAVLLFGIGDTLPTEHQQDVLVLEHPLPTREELQSIVRQVEKDAQQKNAKLALDDATVKQAVDALIGLPAFPAEQSSAMCLDTDSGVLDIEQLWTRKRDIVSVQGLTFCQPKETLADMYGNEGFGHFATSLMGGDFAPNVILRLDEIEKQFAGNGTDSSGSTGKLLSEFLSWIQDNGVICTLLLGVPGTSKSWAPWCIAGHYKKPLIKYDIAAMESKYVGEGHRVLRENNRKVEAISDKKIWLIATANSLRGLPPELLSRFQIGGIFFFDVPTNEEQQGIMKLKMQRYDRPQQDLPDMTNWSGRDIDCCARRSQLLNLSLTDAGRLIIPLMTSHKEEMEALRQSAHGKYLSASKVGVYERTERAAAAVAGGEVLNGRRIR